MPHIINNKYPVQVWLASMLIGSLLFITTFRSYDAMLIFLIILFNLVFSIPTLGAYFLAFHILADVPASIVFIKLLMAIVAIICTFVTFQLLGFPFPKHFLDKSLYLYYSIAILIGSFLFRLRKTKKAPPQARSL
jgi:hypothetical protein